MIQILILATQFGFEKNLNFLAIFRHFGHCAQGANYLANEVGKIITSLNQQAGPHSEEDVFGGPLVIETATSTMAEYPVLLST